MIEDKVCKVIKLKMLMTKPQPVIASEAKQSGIQSEKVKKLCESLCFSCLCAKEFFQHRDAEFTKLHRELSGLLR
jgi:hypothetical protein